MDTQKKIKALETILDDDAMMKEILAEAEKAEKEAENRGIAYAVKEAFRKITNKAKPPVKDEEPAAEEEMDAEEESVEDEEMTEDEEKAEDKPVEDEEDAGEEEAEDEEMTEDEEKAEVQEIIGNLTLDEFETYMRAILADLVKPAAKMTMAADAAKRKAEKETRQTEVASLEKMIEKQNQALSKMQTQLKELRGETPRAFRGYRATEDDNTEVDPETVKEAGPKADPLTSFMQSLNIGNNGG